MAIVAKLTHGLAPVSDRETRYSLITDVLDDRWDGIERVPKTIQAESGLGIAGLPVYYFVMRTERAFGRVVFVYVCHEAVDSPPDGGATPFDSGGLWHGHVHTDPEMAQDEKRHFFAEATVQLSDWNETFEAYVRENYPTIGTTSGGRVLAKVRRQSSQARRTTRGRGRGKYEPHVVSRRRVFDWWAGQCYALTTTTT